MAATGRRLTGEEGTATEGMALAEVHRVLDALDDAGCRAWMAGGGASTRSPAGRRDRTGTSTSSSRRPAWTTRSRRYPGWATTSRPTGCRSASRSPHRADDGWICTRSSSTATGTACRPAPTGTTFGYPAACLVTGALAGRDVACLSVDRQIEAHTGFDLREADRADLALLRRQADGEP